MKTSTWTLVFGAWLIAAVATLGALFMSEIMGFAPCVLGFHLLLVAGYIPESLAPCRQGIPCSTLQVQWLGFITIPLLSFFAFLVVNALLITTYLKTPK